MTDLSTHQQKLRTPMLRTLRQLEHDEITAAAADYIDELEGEIKRIRAGYAECFEDMAEWASYAGDYFQTK